VTKILVVDDDLALTDVLAFTLRRAGLEVSLAHDGRQALEQFVADPPDLIVLDWNLPCLNGLEVCTRVRADSLVPIIMLTVHGADDDVEAALEAGADDYVVKPFSPRQFVARVRAALRRASGEPEQVLRVGPISFDPELRQLHWLDSTSIQLSRLETRLMQTLMRNPGHVLSTESLIARIWGPDGATRDMLKQLVYRLRNKIEAEAGNTFLIETIPEVGYMLHSPPDS
jgi:DNA-binding response OmpR family regulator